MKGRELRHVEVSWWLRRWSSARWGSNYVVLWVLAGMFLALSRLVGREGKTLYVLFEAAVHKSGHVQFASFRARSPQKDASQGAVKCGHLLLGNEVPTAHQSHKSTVGLARTFQAYAANVVSSIRGFLKDEARL